MEKKMRFHFLLAAALFAAILAAAPVSAVASDAGVNARKAALLNGAEAIRTALAASPRTVTVNEYDLFKLRRAEAEKRLALADGKSTAEIRTLEELCSFDPTAYYSELQSQGTEALAASGYSDEQIDAISQFDGSEEAVYRASANVTSELVILSRASTPTRKTFQAQYTFAWSGKPGLLSTDFAAITAEHYYASGGTGRIYYRRGSEPPMVYRCAAVQVPDSAGHGVGMEIPVRKTITENGAARPYIVSSGNLTVDFYNENGIVQTGVMGSYEHATVDVSFRPFVSVGPAKGADGGLELDFAVQPDCISLDELVVSVR